MKIKPRVTTIPFLMFFIVVSFASFAQIKPRSRFAEPNIWTIGGHVQYVRQQILNSTQANSASNVGLNYGRFIGEKLMRGEKLLFASNSSSFGGRSNTQMNIGAGTYLREYNWFNTGTPSARFGYFFEQTLSFMFNGVGGRGRGGPGVTYSLDCAAGLYAF